MVCSPTAARTPVRKPTFLLPLPLPPSRSPPSRSLSAVEEVGEAEAAPAVAPASVPVADGASRPLWRKLRVVELTSRATPAAAATALPPREVPPLSVALAGVADTAPDDDDDSAARGPTPAEAEGVVIEEGAPPNPGAKEPPVRPGTGSPPPNEEAAAAEEEEALGVLLLAVRLGVVEGWDSAATALLDGESPLLLPPLLLCGGCCAALRDTNCRSCCALSMASSITAPHASSAMLSSSRAASSPSAKADRCRAVARRACRADWEAAAATAAETA